MTMHLFEKCTVECKKLTQKAFSISEFSLSSQRFFLLRAGGWIKLCPPNPNGLFSPEALIIEDKLKSKS
jgi:hypothetical protein